MEPRPALKWYSSPRKLLRAILMLDDTQHSIALGTAFGMFIGMTPTVGIQMLIVFLVSVLTRKFFRFNVLAALITVYISNPLTLVPIYYFNFWVGTHFLEGHATEERLGEILGNEAGLGRWDQLTTLFVEFGWPLFWGSLVVATVFSLLTYPAMRWLLKNFKKKTARKAAKRATADVAKPASSTEPQSSTH